MEQRNRGIDLLRMTAMWMVVILHILNKGGVLAAAAPLSAGQGTARLLETAAYCAVNCYGLISGYVGVQRRFRYSGALALWLRVAFYTLGITAVFACLMPGSVNGDRVLRAFFPVLFRQYWYVTAYFGMCLFIPFFNLLLNRLSKGQLRLLALSIVLVFSVLPTLRQKDVFLTDNGYSVLWLACLYLLGGVLRLCGRQTSRRPASWGAIYADCVLATWLVRLAGDRLWMARTGHLCDKVLLTAYTSPTVLLAAVALVLCFAAPKTAAAIQRCNAKYQSHRRQQNGGRGVRRPWRSACPSSMPIPSSGSTGWQAGLRFWRTSRRFCWHRAFWAARLPSTSSALWRTSCGQAYSACSVSKRFPGGRRKPYRPGSAPGWIRSNYGAAYFQRHGGQRAGEAPAGQRTHAVRHLRPG